MGGAELIGGPVIGSRLPIGVNIWGQVVAPLMLAPKGSVLEELSKAAPKQASVAAATWHLRQNFQVQTLPASDMVLFV